MKTREELLYRAQLKRCGFRSWKQANRRRVELIDAFIESHSVDVGDELKELQLLAELYLGWKYGKQEREQRKVLDKLASVLIMCEKSEKRVERE